MGKGSGNCERASIALTTTPDEDIVARWKEERSIERKKVVEDVYTQVVEHHHQTDKWPSLAAIKQRIQFTPPPGIEQMFLTMYALASDDAVPSQEEIDKFRASTVATETNGMYEAAAKELCADGKLVKVGTRYGLPGKIKPIVNKPSQQPTELQQEVLFNLQAYYYEHKQAVTSVALFEYYKNVDATWWYDEANAWNRSLHALVKFGLATMAADQTFIPV